jgi:hypothetical protein
MSVGALSLLGGLGVLGRAAPAGASGFAYVSPYGTDAGPNNCSSSSNPCLTLQHAYNEVNSGGTIVLAGGTYKAGVTISKTVTIEGPASGGTLDANTATIEAFGDGECGFYVSGATVSISNVVIDGLHDSPCDGIDNVGGDVTLTNVVSEDNTVYASGGGLFNDSGTIDMTGGSLLGNAAVDGSGGGGVFNSSGTVTLKNVSLNHNTATCGGGIYNQGTLHLTGSTSLHNNAASNEGGGIDNIGGTVTTTSGVSNTANTPNDFSTFC